MVLGSTGTKRSASEEVSRGLLRVIEITRYCRTHRRMIRGRICPQCESAIANDFSTAQTPSEMIAIAKRLAAAGGGL